LLVSDELDGKSRELAELEEVLKAKEGKSAMAAHISTGRGKATTMRIA
jgi:hypothetical protein